MPASDAALEIAKILEIISYGVPGFGQPLEALFGVIGYVLEKAKKFSDNEQTLTRLALRTGELVVLVQRSLKSGRHHISDDLAARLDELTALANEISDFFDVYQKSLGHRFSVARRVLPVPNSAEAKVRAFEKRRSEIDADLQFIMGLESLDKLGHLKELNETMLSHTEEIRRHIIASPQQESTPLPPVQEEINTFEEEGIVNHTWEEFELEDRLRGIHKPRRRPSEGVVAVCYLGKSRRDGRHMLLKKWSADKTKAVQKAFREDVQRRVKARDPALLQLAGVISPFGSEPWQVFHFPEHDLSVPFLQLWNESLIKDPVQAILSLIELPSMLKHWSKLQRRHGFTHTVSHQRDRERAWLEGLIFQRSHTNSREFKLVYAGELFSRDEEDASGEDLVPRRFAIALRPADQDKAEWMEPFFHGLCWTAPRTHGIEHPNEQLTIEELYNELRNHGWLAKIPERNVNAPFQAKLGDVYFLNDHGDVVVVDNVHEKIVPLAKLRQEITVVQEDGHPPHQTYRIHSSEDHIRLEVPEAPAQGILVDWNQGYEKETEVNRFLDAHASELIAANGHLGVASEELHLVTQTQWRTGIGWEIEGEDLCDDCRDSDSPAFCFIRFADMNDLSAAMIYPSWHPNVHFFIHDSQPRKGEIRECCRKLVWELDGEASRSPEDPWFEFYYSCKVTLPRQMLTRLLIAPDASPSTAGQLERRQVNIWRDSLNLAIRTFDSQTRWDINITRDDVLALNRIKDVTVDPPTPNSPDSFRINFTFEPNECFEDTTLSIIYLKNRRLQEHIATLHGTSYKVPPGSIRVIGSTIHWKHGYGYAPRTILRKIRNGELLCATFEDMHRGPSFFSLFSPPVIPEENQNLSKRAIKLLKDEIEGHYEHGCLLLMMIGQIQQGIQNQMTIPWNDSLQWQKLARKYFKEGKEATAFHHAYKVIGVDLIPRGKSPQDSSTSDTDSELSASIGSLRRRRTY